MRTVFASLATIALCLAAAACEPARRDVQINWTFGDSNLSCTAAGVATIEVDIAGEYLTPNQYSCQDSAGSPTVGIDVGRFLTGTYEIAIYGYDATGNTLYFLDQDISVRSSIDPNVFNLTVPVYSPTTQPTGQGNLILYWTFGGKSCGAADISAVQVTIDGNPVTGDHGSAALRCTNDGTDGIEIGPIDSGSHSVEVDGLVGSNIAFSTTFSAAIQADHDTQLTKDIPAVSVSPTASTAILTWSFSGMSCASALVDSVHVFVDGTDTATLPCTANGGGDGGQVANVSAGSHTISISGVRGTGSSAQLVYQSAGSTASFQAGAATHLIVDASATTPGVGGATLTFAFPAGGPDCTSTAASTTVTYTLTSPAGVAKPSATATCGGASGNTSISICDPGAAGCGAGNVGLNAGVWTIAASATSGATSYTAAGPFAVPNDAVGSSTLTFF